jgi:hypothetical protein
MGVLKMTPAEISKWTLPIAIAAASFTGFAMIWLSMRTGWIRKSIGTAMVSFGLIGAVLLLSPKWENLIVKIGNVEAEMARLKADNEQLAARNNSLEAQIRQVASLGSGDYPSAEDLVSKIYATRESVDWAKFLPSNDTSFGVALKPNTPAFKNVMGAEFGADAARISKLIEDSQLTLVKPAGEAELKLTTPSDLWIMPAGGTNSQMNAPLR